MKTKELTTTINTKLTHLKATVNSLPCGGGLERLDTELDQVINDIKEFQVFLAEVNRMETGKQNGNTSPGKETTFGKL